MHDLPAKRTENETVALLCFIDKFFVRFPYFNAIFRSDRIKSFIRNRSARGNGEHPAITVSFHFFMNPVIQNPGSGRNIPFMLVIPCQHFQHRLYVSSRYVTKRPCSGQYFHNFIERIAFKSRHGNEMLRQYIQTAFRRIHPFHAPVSCKLRSQTAQNAFRRRPRKHIHGACSERIMSRPPEPLHRTGNRPRTAYLQYLVYFAHIDAEFHRRCGAQKP